MTTPRRLADNPIVCPRMDDGIGQNINGPSLIRVPDWVDRPLGRYYLYFAHHGGQYIRLAYADEVTGPWTVYQPGTLTLEQSYCASHIASPDVHVDEGRRCIRMYYHGVIKPEDRPSPDALELDDPIFRTQRTRVAVSSDGLHFTARPAVVAGAYFRVFEHDGWYYGLAMPGALYRSRDPLSPFEFGGFVLAEPIELVEGQFGRSALTPRHMAVRVDRSTSTPVLHVYYSRMNDEPEHIVHATMPLDGDWRSWRACEPVTCLRPERPYEGSDCPHVASNRGAVHEPVWQLRDPAIFEEAGRTYLVYSVAGESGLALAAL